MRICLISERLTPPYDEGIKNYAWQLARHLAQEHELLMLTAFCAQSSAPDATVREVATNRLFLSTEMAQALHRFGPELVLYVPTACATLFSFARTRVLQSFVGTAPVVMIALQWRPYRALARKLMPWLCPRLVLVQSEATRASLVPFGCRLAQLPASVDTQRFVPAAQGQKLALRTKYGLTADTPIVLHVGHLNAGRNVQAMLAVQQLLPVQTMVVGSSSTPQDANLVAELRQGGVLVLDRYLPELAEVYQLADCYLFPVRAAMSAIDLPLSVLEAMACNLPVVTTRHSGLERFAGAPGLVFVEGTDEMPDAVARCLALRQVNTRRLVEPMSYQQSMPRLIHTIQQALAGDPEEGRTCDIR